MAIVTAATGLVTSWAGTPNTALVGSSNSSPAEFTLNLNAPEADVTAFVSGGVNSRSYLSTLIDWSGTIKCQMKPATIGSAGNITFAGMPQVTGANINVGGWTLDLSAYTSPPVTAMAASAPTYQAFIPGIYDWKASVKAWLDGTTPIVAPGGGAVSIALKVAEDGATDPGFTGNGFATQVGVPVKVGEVTELSYAIRGTGDLTAVAGASTWSAWWFAAGAIALPAAGSLVLQAATGRTYTGSAFWKSLKITCMLDEPVTLEIGFQGSGTLTIA